MAKNGKLAHVWRAAVGFPVAHLIGRASAPAALARAAISALALLMRARQRPFHGGPIGPAPPRGGAVCGGTRLEKISREKNIQRAEYSAFLATRMPDRLVR
eukprot:5558044-Pyramimonas_sp.AAC.1